MSETSTAAGAAAAAGGGAGASVKREESLRETLVSIVIAFVLAFVFRSFVVEPFVIPTGSMAPTLLGAHMRFTSPFSGHTWTVNPRDYGGPNRDTPLPVQGAGQAGPITVTDPMTGRPIVEQDVARRAGDRILVLKQLYTLFSPRRWDVVVFKNPEDPTVNYIKRLVGLPGEELWIAAGDVFTRPTGEGEDAWRIARKPARIQRSLWRPIFSSERAPRTTVGASQPWSAPWNAEGVDTSGQQYRVEPAAGGAVTLAWNEREWPIDDWNSYNDIPALRAVGSGVKRYPVSDVRLRAALTPEDAAAFEASAVIEASGHEFRLTLRERLVEVFRREAIAGAEWEPMGSRVVRVFRSGRATDVEFWHVDQRLSVRLGGREVLTASYEWGPAERTLFATGERVGPAGVPAGHVDLLAPGKYRRSGARWELSGSAATMARVGLDRDLFYQPTRRPARAVFPDTTMRLGEDQFFVLGDNSPASKDSRLWDRVDPWVAAALDPTMGVVPRDLMMGKAFFVYFPSPLPGPRNLPVPDFGRMRFIK